jgi:hypothetical protein
MDVVIPYKVLKKTANACTAITADTKKHIVVNVR